MTDQEILEAISYIRDVFPPGPMFDSLVEEGAYGHEVHSISGDDLAGACYHLNRLMEHFGLPNNYMERYKKLYG